MTGKLDYLLVIDLESTCWESTPPHGQRPEIIEIGVCTLDIQTGARLARQSILVRPEHSQVSPFCTALTSLTPAQVARGVPFERACQILRHRYHASDHVWASYGDYDRRTFEQQCTARGIAYPLGQTHLNIKNLFALMHGLPREVGMLQALELLGLPLEGRHHRGVDDAWNAALILARLLLGCRTHGWPQAVPNMAESDRSPSV